MKLRSKFIILILVFLLYSFVYKSETAFAQCSWTQCDSATCCNFYDCGGLDCDKEGKCWWTTIVCSSCYDCGSCYTVYDNGAACSTGSGPGVCSGGSCVPTCTYAANPCNCNQCGQCGFINQCTGFCSIGSPPPLTCTILDSVSVSPSPATIGQPVTVLFNGYANANFCAFQYQLPGSTTWSSAVTGPCTGISLTIAAGQSTGVYNMQGAACKNDGTCSTPYKTTSVQVNRPLPTLQSISVSPSTITLGQGATLTFGASSNSDSFYVQVLNSAGTVIYGPQSLFGNPSTLDIPGSAVTSAGTYTIEAAACQTTGVCSSPRATATVQVNRPLPTLQDFSINLQSASQGQQVTVSFINPLYQDYCAFQYKLTGTTSWNIITSNPSCSSISWNMASNAQSGTYEVEAAACQNNGQCRPLPYLKKTFIVGPRVDRNTIIINPNPVIVGQGIEIRWTDPPEFVETIPLLGPTRHINSLRG